MTAYRALVRDDRNGTFRIPQLRIPNSAIPNPALPYRSQGGQPVSSMLRMMGSSGICSMVSPPLCCVKMNNYPQSPGRPASPLLEFGHTIPYFRTFVKRLFCKNEFLFFVRFCLPRRGGYQPPVVRHAPGSRAGTSPAPTVPPLPKGRGTASAVEGYSPQTGGSYPPLRHRVISPRRGGYQPPVVRHAHPGPRASTARPYDMRALPLGRILSVPTAIPNFAFRIPIFRLFFLDNPSVKVYIIPVSVYEKYRGAGSLSGRQAACGRPRPKKGG